MKTEKRALVVDDERDIRSGVARWLSSVGIEVVEAEDGERGINMAKSKDPDIIFLDVRMPGNDGMEVLRELRMDVATRKIPVVMLSASLRDEQRALDAGAAYFFPKPYAGRSLVAVAQKLTASRSPSDHEESGAI